MISSTGEKSITAGKLAELLAELPPDVVLVVNAVGNLAVFAAEPRRYLGYIDLLDEEVSIVEDSSPSS